jgi:outer membrane protein OmpA-like peptidoglycan-associated protein
LGITSRGDIKIDMIKIKKGKITITNDIAYIAGFLDGEGCIRIKKANQSGNSYYIWVAITNSNKGILDYIARIFGGSVKKAEKRTNKWIYHYLITSSEATDMLKILLGFLRGKRTQAELAIYFHENKDKLKPEQKKKLYEQMRELKQI